MACNVVPGPITSETENASEAVCVHTRKIYDSCQSKDCMEDLRFYPTRASAAVLANTLTLKGSCSELLRVFVNVEPVCFDRGYFTVDMRFFYRVTLQAYQGTSFRGTEIEGLCVFDKRCILFGSEGSSKVFTSEDADCAVADQALPLAVVEAVDPIVLSTRLHCRCEGHHDHGSCGTALPCETLTEVPECIAAFFASPLLFTSDAPQVFVTLGQFSIVRLERDTQLLIPVYDYCLPEKECKCGNQGDPCELFRDVNFPVSEFFPPDSLECPTDYHSTKQRCCDNCSRS